MKIIKPGVINENLNGFNGMRSVNKNNTTFKGAQTVVANEVRSLITESDRKILNIFSQHYGYLGERLGKKVAKLVDNSEILKKSSRFVIEKGALSIKEKSIGQSLFENIIFPFVNLPLYAGSWVLKKLQLIPAFKEKAVDLYYKPFFRIPRKFHELDCKTDSIKGIFDKTQEVVSNFAKKEGISADELFNKLNNADDYPNSKELIKKANDYIKENLYRVSNKFFDKHTGNYNTAYERPLNRIVSGLIPAVFLANDAYNLSVLCGDTKDMSKKEAAERKKQEISRVFTTAFFQLITFGAFTKQVNNIPWFAPLASAFTVLFSEVSSRMRLGKPIFFLNKDKALKYYDKKNTPGAADKNIQKEETKLKTNDSKNSQDSVILNNLINPKDTPEIFMSFKSTNQDKKSVETKSDSEVQPPDKDSKQSLSKEDKKTKEKEEPKKALINAKTFKNALIVLTFGGFILSLLKNSSLTKNTKPVKAVKNLGSWIKENIYSPLAYKDFEISQTEFNKIIKSIKEAGCREIAEGHEFIKNKYSKTTQDGIIKMYKSELSPSKAGEVIKTTLKSAKEKFPQLSENEYTKIADSLKTAINLEKAALNESNYNDIGIRAAEILKNKKISLDKDQLKLLAQDMGEIISKNTTQKAIKIDRKIKPFVDIVTEPFKFAASALRLPFKIVSSLIKIPVAPIEKKAAKALTQDVQLTDLEKGIHRVVTEIFGEKEARSGKINQIVFANAMEHFEKRTLPYRKAKKIVDNAAKNNLTGDKLKKAKEVLENEKNKLQLYIDRAVENSFNGVTQSSNKNTDLAMVSKLASSAVTSAFLVADNYNMVMIKSKGEDKEGAKETANERIIQRLSALFYQTLLINWFNSTFRSTYNSSLKGMTMVVIPNTITTEILTRKSIGMPVGRKSYEELQANEEKNDNRKGFLGKYFKFMRLLTGKKPLKDRMPKNQTPKTNTTQVKNPKTTNLLERYSK